jgi:hypothetical protein
MMMRTMLMRRMMTLTLTITIAAVCRRHCRWSISSAADGGRMCCVDSPRGLEQGLTRRAGAGALETGKGV